MPAAVIDLIRQRLQNQKLERSKFREPADVVAWLGAVQAQDYAGAKWALGQRANGLTDVRVEQAFNQGAILRTHILRPTWHFVAPADIRWMLALTAPRVKAANAHYYRKSGLDAAIFGRSCTAIERALQGGKQLTRLELAAALQRAGIPAAGQRLAYLMMQAELDGVICSGARRGQQFTYALLEERAPRAEPLRHDEALAELTRRYFSSHGPATVRDYVWWSGLTMRDAKTGLEIVKPALAQERFDNRTYWFVRSRSIAPSASLAVAYLLPNYDEYLIAYKDRGAVVAAARTGHAAFRSPDAFAHPLVIDGRLAGTWRRLLKKDAVFVEVVPYERLPRGKIRALADAARRYGRFMRMPVVLSAS